MVASSWSIGHLPRLSETSSATQLSPVQLGPPEHVAPSPIEGMVSDAWQGDSTSHGISLVLEPADGAPLTSALPGQFIAVRRGFRPLRVSRKVAGSRTDSQNSEGSRHFIGTRPGTL